MPLAPVRREAGRLFAIDNITDEVGRKECQVDHLLDPAFGSAFNREVPLDL